MNEVSFLNALYFVIQSFITTGFGDEVPITNASRGVSIILNTIGESENEQKSSYSSSLWMEQFH